MKAHHILSAASNLLGVALLVVTFVHVTDHARETYADELAFAAALLFLGSCILSHRAIRTSSSRIENTADTTFFVGLVLLLVGVVCFWF